MLVDWLVHEKIGYLPQSLSIVDGLNDILTILRLTFELVVEIYRETRTSISISIRSYTSINIIDSVKGKPFCQANGRCTS